MEITTPPKINHNYTINKAQRDKILTINQIIKPDDEQNPNKIYPYLPISICDNLILQNVNLRNAIDILAEDMIYNNIIIKPKDKNINQNNPNDELIEKITDFWEDNEEELCNQVKDYISYGFGASQILNVDDEYSLAQIPADTLHIEKKQQYNQNKNKTETYYYAVQEITGRDNIYLRLSHLEYPEQDKDLPVCFWLGKGRRSNFFDYPLWIEAFNHVSASINLDLLDAKKINEGNLVSGILVIKRPPLTPTEEDVNETLQEKMENHGSGIFTLDLTSLNPDIPLTVDYVQISESNYQYLKELADKSDAKILSTLRIPKARMLIDDVTESMNSNKTNTLYKIYTIELNNRQRPIEKNMQKFNFEYFGFKGLCSIETPVFVDDKEIEANNIINLFDKGLITLGQAINKVGNIYTEFNEPIDEENPIYNERYYNGQPLGFTEPTNEEMAKLYEIGDYIDEQTIIEQLK